jgi:hypothetical protein
MRIAVWCSRAIRGERALVPVESEAYIPGTFVVNNGNEALCARDGYRKRKITSKVDLWMLVAINISCESPTSRREKG